MKSYETRGLQSGDVFSESGGVYVANGSEICSNYIDINLGWVKRSEFANENWYWGEVRDTTIIPILMANQYGSITTDLVLLHGNCIFQEKFRQVLEDALNAVLPDKPDVFELEPVYSGARGASEMAKQVY
jgi:hypothetical protein